MGLLERIINVIGAKLSKLVGRAEDPRETLDYSYEKQTQMLQQVKRGVADVVTAKNRLRLQSEKLEQSVGKLEGQAREAMAAGREDLARTAIERKVAVQAQLQDLDRQTQELEAQQEKLVANERQLATRIESFRSEKEVIKAQYSAAEAQVKIGEAATGIGDQMGSTARAIERAREKTEQMEARGAALDELIASGTLDDVTSEKTELDRELAQIASQSQVDKELEQMKAEVGAGSGQRQIES
jgi:phage shock protein A